MEDPDAPEAWPRVLLTWRGNALSSSAKGHEYFLRHYLGVTALSIADESPDGVRDAVVRPAPEGKLDLVVALDFRMTTTGLLADIVLPAATSYEKDDLSSTDLHSFIHPMQAAVPPCWEARSDFDAFAALADAVTALAKVHLPEPACSTWSRPRSARHARRDGRSRGAATGRTARCGSCRGRHGPDLAVVERDYAHLADRFRALGPARP